jgi:phage repressor protein C with HTH and peptisase S24 domain
MSIGNKLKELRKYLKFSQEDFAKVLNIAPRAYWNYENNKREMPASNLAQIARTFRINLNWLFGDSSEMILTDNNIYMIASDYEKHNACYNIPIRGEVYASMGYGVTIYNETQTATFSMSQKFAQDIGINPHKAEVIFARGDSMEPTISAGDSILIDLSKRDIFDGIIYCIRLDGQLMIKRLQRLASDSVGIVSDNPKYQLRTVSLLNNIDDFEIIGEVRWWGHIVH